MTERLERGDKGVNGLDELCKEHDIAYASNSDSIERSKADKKLASGALKRLFSRNASLGERAASLLVTTMMKTKTGLSKFGMGLSGCRKKSKKIGVKGRKIPFSKLVKDAKNGITKSGARTINTAIKAALRSAKKSRCGKSVTVPRIIKVPNFTGGILPILPILAGLGAVGSLIGSTAGVVKTIKDMKNAKEQLAENKRHNLAMEKKIGSGLYLGVRKNGSGLYLRPHKRGSGLYLKPASKNLH